MYTLGSGSDSSGIPLLKPDFVSVYQDPDSHADYICVVSDSDFEGQAFDRKQAGKEKEKELFRKADLSELVENVEKTVSAFANATGGLLVVGVSKSGRLLGVSHLKEEFRTALLSLSGLQDTACSTKLHTLEINGEAAEIALFLVQPTTRTFCFRIRDDAAWVRKGPSSISLKGLELEQKKRERRFVEFETGVTDDFDKSDADLGVLKEYSASQGYTIEEDAEQVLHNAGALRGKQGARQWTNAGILFFATKPQRILSYAYIRLLRFECLLEDEDERPTPTFEREFSGPLSKQISDFRTFSKETGFFRTFEVRAADGGFSTEPEYPKIALDESVVNAVAHRDYGIRQPILCERYEDAFVVKSPGRMCQQFELPSEFRLRERRLDSWLRNQTLMDWLRSMRDAQGTAFVKAIREGTQRMRQEMDDLGLPSPTYRINPAQTILILRNDIAVRTSKPTGLRNKDIVESEEFTNLYRLEGFDSDGERNGTRERRRVFMQLLSDRLEASGWFIDHIRKGRIVAHLKGAQESLPDSLRPIVRFIPAYQFTVREFYGRSYLSVDYVLQVQSVVNLNEASTRFGSPSLVGLRAHAVIDGRPIRGRILAIESEMARVLEFDKDSEIVIPATKLFPALRREQLDELVKAAAPRFNFYRARKDAALSSKVGAARDRARRIETIVSEVVNTVFPIVVEERSISLDTAPLVMLDKGDGRRALRAQSVEEPEVEFGRQRSTANIRDGITSYGAFSDQPKDIELVAVTEAGYEQSMVDLVERLKSGKFRYKGAERTFATKLQLARVSPAPEGEAHHECARLLETFPEWQGNSDHRRVFLVHTPESSYSLDDVESPYYRSKRLLLEAGIPCQMVDTPTLQNADYKDLNLALNIVAKTGVAPWKLPESIPEADFFIGLSYTSSRSGAATDRILGFANVFNTYGRWEFYSGGNDAVSYDRRYEHYEQLVESTLSKLSLSETPTICFHYSARFSRADREAIVRGARKICPNGRFTFIWINSHHPLRFFDRTAGTDGSMSRGRFVVGAPNQIYLSTTGYNQYRKIIGTPLALEINAYNIDNTSDDNLSFQHRAIAQQILSLTKLNWASTDSLCGEPITIKYAKDIARLTAAFQRQQRGAFTLHPVLEKTPWFI